MNNDSLYYGNDISAITWAMTSIDKMYLTLVVHRSRPTVCFVNWTAIVIIDCLVPLKSNNSICIDLLTGVSPHYISKTRVKRAFKCFLLHRCHVSRRRSVSPQLAD